MKSNEMRQDRTPIDWIPVLAILLAGLNLRPVLASISPLLDEIQHATGMTSTQAGLLTTLPVVMMGLCALLGGRLQAALGEKKGITLGAVIIAVACNLRGYWPSTIGLVGTAVMGGLGIALVQALLPAYIKRAFSERTSMMMGLYTTCIMGGAAMAAATISPLAAKSDWMSALQLWSMPAMICALLWFCIPSIPKSDRPAAPLPLDNPRAWLLMLFFGIGTGAYTLVLAWLPPFYTRLGWSQAESGLLLGALTLVEVVAGLVVSATISKFPDRRIPLTTVLVLMILGLGCLVVAPASLAIPAAVLLGLGIGSLFPLSLIVTMDHIYDADSAGVLMGFVQGGGYIIASIMPMVAGLMRENLDSLESAWIAMGVQVCLLIVMAFRFKPSTSG